MAKHTSLSKLVAKINDRIRQSVRVSVVARVESFDPATSTADVKIVVQEERVTADGDRIPIEAVSIPGCPVLWPGGWLRGMTVGLEQGDEVIALIRTQSHDEIDGDRDVGPVLPAAARRMDLSDVVLIPGYHRPAASWPSSRWRSDGQMVLYVGSGEAVFVGDSTAAKALALAEKVNARLTSIQSKYDTHKHASSSAIPDTLIGPLDPVDCADVKVRS